MTELKDDLADLARHFLSEASEAQAVDYPAIDDAAALPLLNAWANCLEWARTANLSDRDLRGIVSAGERAIEQHEKFKTTSGSTKGNALSGLAAHLDVFLAVFNELEAASGSAHPLKDKRDLIESAGRQSSLLMNVVVYVSGRTASLDQAVTAARDSAAAAQAAVDLAEKAATKTATSALERSFEETAKTNDKTARRFRTATLCTLGVAVALGAIFVLTHVPVAGEAVDWYGIVYRLAVISGLGAIAAYLARQANNHARLATWANGIAIQLKAFLGFVNEIDDEAARMTMFTLFGKRVLESPPDGKTSSDENPISLIQPIFEQASRFKPPQQ